MISILLAGAIATTAHAAPPLDGQWMSSTGNFTTVGGSAALALGQGVSQWGDGNWLGATGDAIKTGGLVAAPLGLLMSYAGNKMMIADLKERYLDIDDSAMAWASGLSLIAIGSGGASYLTPMIGMDENVQDWLIWASVAASAGAGLALYVQDKRSNVAYRAGVYHEDYGYAPPKSHFSARLTPTGNGFSLMGTF